ncbi:MAG TPA: ABC transporter ATP-binding protein, partial [bacterium]|nr:ABC transporter ATP-binding protein [bacterium]
LYRKWTGRAHIDFIRSLNGGDDLSEELIRRLDFDPTVKIKQLSSGNKQKLGIILAFMLKPEVLILDEPTLGLDPLLQNGIYELLGEMTQEGTTVFMSSHNLAEVDRVCSRVGIIKKGKMVATENIATLKEKKINTVNAYFAHPVNKDEFLDENTELVREYTNGLILRVKSDVNPLIKRLSRHTLRDINIAQASLEDIFMEYYEKV